MNPWRIFAAVFIATWSIVVLVWYKTEPSHIKHVVIEKPDPKPAVRTQHTYGINGKAPGYSYLSAFTTLIDIVD